MSTRLWFAGTPAFAAHNLQTLIDSGDRIVRRMVWGGHGWHA